jgi:phage shock protein PspC (stress-responsive transcriptional regulator)
MNKILNINLGGYALTIDDDAYEYLNGYLDSIRRRFSESEGRDEIIGDIETRLGELITQGMGARSIVMLPDAEAAVAVMGKPEDFGGAEPASSSGSNTNKKSERPAVRTGKRLFRDEEDAVVSGVCSGLAAYLGIQDPVWVRLIFVLFTIFSGGSWILAYFFFWALVPPAKSAADRLAMRGEPVNMDNIAREVEVGFERLGKKMDEIGTQGAKKGGSTAQNVVSTSVTAIGQIFGFMVRFFAKFAVLIAIIVGIALFIALVVGWIGSIWGLLVAAPAVDYFSPYSSGVTWLGVVNTFFLLGIPLIGVCLLFTRVLFKTRTPSWLGGGLTLFWVLNLISAVFLVGYAAKEYRQTGSVTKTIDLSAINSDTLRVEGFDNNQSDREGNFWFHEEGITISDEKIQLNGPLEIRVVPSRDGQFHCTQITKAQGSSNLKAQENADQVAYEIGFSGNTLRVPTSYSLPKGKKWRVQRIRLNIEVPDGKSVTFDEKIYHYAAADLDEYDDENERNYISRRPGRMFRMGRGGLVCTDCPNFGDKGYRSDRRYENFIMEGDFTAEIRDGNDFRVEIEGPAAEKAKIQKIQTGDKITFTTNGKSVNNSVRIFIQTPTFTSLHADNTGEIVIRGFDEGRASISASGRSRVRGYLDVSGDLDVALSGQATLDLTGGGGRLDASLSDDAVLEATNWRARDVEVSASEKARARVFADSDAVLRSTGESSVKVDGGANVRNKQEEN